MEGCHAKERITTAGILAREGKYLVGRRVEGGVVGGLWEFPGGKRRKGETAEEALRREWMEELNVSVRVGPLVMESDFSSGETLYHLKAFLVACDDFSPLVLRFHSEIRYLALSEMDAYPFVPSDRPIVRALQREKNS